MGYKRLSNHDQELRTASDILLLLRSPRADWPMRLCMASAPIFKMHTHESRSETALRLHGLESGFLGGSRSKTPFFSRFKSLIWNSFAFTWTKIRLSNQEKGRITFRNVFRNVILVYVNTPTIYPRWTCHAWYEFVQCSWLLRRGWYGQGKSSTNHARAYIILSRLPRVVCIDIVCHRVIY